MTTTTTTGESRSDSGGPAAAFQPQVCVVDFHHARGPEVEFWVTSEGKDLFERNEWGLLPFMALSDGAHASTEEWSYFTLRNKKLRVGGGEAEGEGDGSLLGIACTRQIRSERLKMRASDVTRSSVQKSVVVVVRDARGLGELRTRLGIVAEMWFEQADFSDVEILREFQESLRRTSGLVEGEHYFGLSLREVVRELRWQTLVLVKAFLLQRKILFFGSRCERLCLLQFALLSLMPGLMANLEDCAHPDLDSSMRPSPERDPSLPPMTTTCRSGLMTQMGHPLRIFSKGAVFMPYAPLQHLDLLASYETKSYVVGSTNSLLLQQKERYADLLVNLDEQNSITILSTSLKQALQLSAADRRWIDQLTQTVLDTWDEENPGRPKGMGYRGSEESIRLAFEEYILSLCSSMAYQVYREEVGGENKSFDALSEAVKARRSMEKEKMRQEFDESALPIDDERPSTPQPPPKLDTNIPPDRTIISSPPKKVDLLSQSYDPADNAVDFTPAFLSAWRDTLNCQRFIEATENKRIFELVEPRHPTAGGFNIDDLNRRLAQNLGDWRKEYKVDERVSQAKERAGEVYMASRERFGRLWEVVEERRRGNSRMRNASQVRSEAGAGRENENEKPAVPMGAEATPRSSGEGSGNWSAALREKAVKVQRPDTEAMQKAARENAARAGAYLSSWGTWARSKGAEWQKGRDGGGDGGGTAGGVGGVS